MICAEVAKAILGKNKTSINGRLNDHEWMIKRIRRRVEEHLRKEANEEQVLAVAEFLGIKKGFGLD